MNTKSRSKSKSASKKNPTSAQRLREIAHRDTYLNNANIAQDELKKFKIMYNRRKSTLKIEEIVVSKTSYFRAEELDLRVVFIAGKGRFTVSIPYEIQKKKTRDIWESKLDTLDRIMTAWFNGMSKETFTADDLFTKLPLFTDGGKMKTVSTAGKTSKLNWMVKKTPAKGAKSKPAKVILKGRKSKPAKKYRSRPKTRKQAFKSGRA